MFEGNNKWTNSDVIEFNRLVEKIRQAAYHGNNKVCHICSTNKLKNSFHNLWNMGLLLIIKHVINFFKFL